MGIKITHCNRLWSVGTSLKLLHFLHKIAATTMPEILDRLEHRRVSRAWTDWVRSATSLLHLSYFLELFSIYFFTLSCRVSSCKNLRLWLFDFFFALIWIFSTILTGLTAKTTKRDILLMMIVDVKIVLIMRAFLISFDEITFVLTWLKLVWELHFINALQLTNKTQRPLMFFQILVVVVQSSYWEASRHT